MKLPAGKVPPALLEGLIFKRLGTRRKEVVVGPSLGVDGAVVRIGDRLLVSSMDPITGALERIGWLAVNINANDVATFGVRPAFFSSCILLPEHATEAIVRTVCRQIDSGAKKLGMAVIGGHSETTPGLVFPIVIGCCMGVTEQGRYVTSKGARAGNDLILTKSAGMEGTAILAADRRPVLADALGNSVVKKAAAFFRRISVVDDALLAFGTGGVTAMHDPTEGGIANGIHELADASNKGFRIFEDRISIAEETVRICRFFRIDPMCLIASGSLLIAAEKDFSGKIVKVLRKSGIAAAVIGELLSSTWKRAIVRRDGREERLARPVSDHLWRASATISQ
ncbi:MAG: AIR synthase family protein [Deltaproteobacteria bacterium]|jgi:hydrogenase maturation factor|nr:AIR synthase family protein [Deltaproteobacteria bacterium]MDA8179252.1 AIR synthase family protein [Deltaproteobacteria bacterium]